MTENDILEWRAFKGHSVCREEIKTFQIWPVCLALSPSQTLWKSLKCRQAVP